MLLRGLTRALSLFAGFFLVLSSSAQSQTGAGAAPSGRKSPMTYGTASDVIESVGWMEFRPETMNETYATNFSSFTDALTMYVTTTPAANSNPWWARVRLPNGALIQAVELDACDITTTGDIAYGLQVSDAGVYHGDLAALGFTGTAFAGGCSIFSTSVAPFAVDNAAHNYLLFFSPEGDIGSHLQVQGMRVRYRLQVSPDPATATFADVPVGHPQHRFVEALVAAGITAGCGGGNFCPTQPITRGQMAVFLSVALGLHWPN